MKRYKPEGAFDLNRRHQYTDSSRKESPTDRDQTSDRGITVSVENYLKAVYTLEQQGLPGETNRLCTVLGGIKPASVTAMIKKLAERGLVEYIPYQGVKLTPAGRLASLKVLRRHRLIELYLLEQLDYAWDEVHREAEQLEHYVSDTMVDRMATKLGHPEFDPHGDPIPAPDGTIPARESVTLADSPSGRRLLVLRVLDQSPESLRYLADQGLTPGAVVQVLARDQNSGTVLVGGQERELTLDRSLASRILVTSSLKPSSNP